MADPGEQINVAAIVAELDASRQRIAAELALQSELLRQLGATATDQAAMPSEPEDKRPFPGLFSGTEAGTLVSVESYVASDSLSVAVEEKLSPYRTSLLYEFDKRSHAQQHSMLKRPIQWSVQNHPITYGYRFDYGKSTNDGPGLRHFSVSQFLVGDSNASSLTTNVAFSGNDIREISVDWKTDYRNPQFPDVYCENLGSRSPDFDEHYRKLVIGTFNNKPLVRPGSTLTISGFHGSIQGYTLSFGRPGDGVATYTYNESLADGPAFVLSKHETKFTGPRADPDTISIEDFLGWVDFALGTIPPSDMPIGPRAERPALPA